MKTIIEMAREARLEEMWELTPRFIRRLEAFAALVRAEAQAEEREACAKAVLKIANDDAGNPYKQALRMGADAIRTRGNT